MMFTVNNKLGMGGYILLFTVLPYMEILKRTKHFHSRLTWALLYNFYSKKYTFYTSFDFGGGRGGGHFLMLMSLPLNLSDFDLK